MTVQFNEPTCSTEQLPDERSNIHLLKFALATFMKVMIYIRAIKFTLNETPTAPPRARKRVS